MSANEVLQREIEPLLQPPIEEVLESSLSSGTTTFFIKLEAGVAPGEWWPRRNGIRVSCFPEWALS